MRKIGGILILCVTVFGLIANGLISAFIWPILDESDLHSTVSAITSSLLVAFVVITLAIILLNTRGKWPAISILVMALLTIWQGWGGFIWPAMVIAAIGALLALMPAKPEATPTAQPPALPQAPRPD